MFSVYDISKFWIGLIFNSAKHERYDKRNFHKGEIAISSNSLYLLKYISLILD